MKNDITNYFNPFKTYARKNSIFHKVYLAQDKTVL